MSKKKEFLRTIRSKDQAWLKREVSKRDEQLRTLKFDLGFGKVDALAKIRRTKRERAQLLGVLTETAKSKE